MTLNLLEHQHQLAFLYFRYFAHQLPSFSFSFSFFCLLCYQYSSFYLSLWLQRNMNKLVKQELDHDQEDYNLKKRQKFWKIMEVPELSLAPTRGRFNNTTTNSLFESEANLSKKRKSCSDHHLLNTDPTIQTSVDLQLKDPLPLDWEQCLDLESGRMYYLNRKTLRKSWECPKDHKLDLELNMSTCSDQIITNSETFRDSKKQHSSSTNMVALPCLNCHLLVILSKSSPSCPNCKYVHSLPTQQMPLASDQVPTTVKSQLDTLTFLKH